MAEEPKDGEYWWITIGTKPQIKPQIAKCYSWQGADEHVRTEWALCGDEQSWIDADGIIPLRQVEPYKEE